MSFDALTLDCFIAVAETGSFTKAAERVGRTQSAVSQQIARLENQLNKSLFVRGKNLSLTNDGKTLLSYARTIATLYHEVIDKFLEPELQGEIRLGLPDDFASVYFPDILVEFKRLHPWISLSVECDLTSHLYKRFKKKEFDIVLVKMPRPDEFPYGMEIGAENLEWVGNSELFTHDKEQPVPLILSPDPCMYREAVMKALQDAGRKCHIVFSSHSHASKMAAVKAGMGITALPRHMIPADLHLIKPRNGIPPLGATPLSLLKHNERSSINSLEKYLTDRLRLSGSKLS